MLFSILAAASLMSEPVLGPGELFSFEDFPKNVDYVGELIGTRVAITTRRDSSVRDCVVLLRSVNQNLDALTCSVLMKRARFTAPAKWLDGSPAYSVWRQSILWATDQNVSIKDVNADVDVGLRKLPFGLIKPAIIDVVFAVDEAGKMIACEGVPPTRKGGSSERPERVQFACDQLRQTYRPSIVLDDQGRAVRSIQNATVKIEKQR